MIRWHAKYLSENPQSRSDSAVEPDRPIAVESIALAAYGRVHGAANNPQLFGISRNRQRQGLEWVGDGDGYAIDNPLEQFTMTKSRFLLTLAAATVSFGVAVATAPFAAEMGMSKDHMENSNMSKDTMKKDTMGKQDTIGKQDTMGKDNMDHNGTMGH